MILKITKKIPITNKLTHWVKNNTPIWLFLMNKVVVKVWDQTYKH